MLLADDLILAKTPCLKQMIDALCRKWAATSSRSWTCRASTSTATASSKSGATTAGSCEVQGLVEKPAADKAPSNVAVIGRYILEPGVFEHLDRQNRGAGGEIQLTDAMATLIGRSPFHGLRFEGKRFDCGDKVGFFEANIAFALARQDLGADVRGILKQLHLSIRGRRPRPLNRAEHEDIDAHCDDRHGLCRPGFRRLLFRVRRRRRLRRQGCRQDRAAEEGRDPDLRAGPRRSWSPTTSRRGGCPSRPTCQVGGAATPTRCSSRSARRRGAATAMPI